MTANLLPRRPLSTHCGHSAELPVSGLSDARHCLCSRLSLLEADGSVSPELALLAIGGLLLATVLAGTFVEPVRAASPYRLLGARDARRCQRSWRDRVRRLPPGSRRRRSLPDLHSLLRRPGHRMACCPQGGRACARAFDLGVVISAATVAAAAVFILGVTWLQACLLGAVVASTDAAAVFAILRSTKPRSQRRRPSPDRAGIGLERSDRHFSGGGRPVAHGGTGRACPRSGP